MFEQSLNAKYLQIISHHIHMSFLSMNQLSPSILLPSPVSFGNYKTKKLLKHCKIGRFWVHEFFWKRYSKWFGTETVRFQEKAVISIQNSNFDQQLQFRQENSLRSKILVLTENFHSKNF